MIFGKRSAEQPVRLFSAPKIQTVKIEITHPPSLVEVRDALLAVQDAQQALLRAEACWTAPQLEDALRSAKFFINEASKRLQAGIAKRGEEVKNA